MTRKLSKELRIKLFWFKKKLIYNFYNFIGYRPNVKSIKETIDTIIRNNASLVRFGDGEVFVMHGGYLGFQRSNSALSERLWEIYKQNSSNKILICIQGIINGFEKKYKKEVIDHWKKHLYAYASFYYSNRRKMVNYDTCATRLYSQFTTPNQNLQFFELWKKVWQSRDVVVIEGALTRFGIGNDFLSSASNIERILCPPENAFDKYEEIYQRMLQLPKNKLILIALGPTATVLAYDLAMQGFQAIDIGHLDIEYEWSLQNVAYKTKIKGKYVNENRDNGELIEEIESSEYTKQIIDRII